MISVQKAISIVDQILSSYFVSRDMDAILSMMSKEVRWIHYKNFDKVHNYDELSLLINGKKIQANFNYILLNVEHSSLMLSDTSINILSKLTLKASNSKFDIDQIELMLTTTVVLNKDTMNIIFFQLSCPVIKEASHWNFNELSQNLPGGIFSCKYDEKLTILQMNSGFLSMIGYTADEIEHEMDNSLANLIDPRDKDDTVKEVERQLAISDVKTIEYRLICKDGSTIWVLDKGHLIRVRNEIPTFCCIVIDITKEKEVRQELKLSLQRQEIIMNQTNNIIFEWDIIQDVFSFPNKWNQEFKFKTMIGNVSSDYLAKNYIHEQDMALFLSTLHEVSEGKRYLDIDIRIERKDGEYSWVELRMTTQYNDMNQAIYSVGVLIDIDDKKRRSVLLSEKAQRDPLTKLLNKEVSQSYITHSLLEKHEMSALMIIDIDDFKLVNDTMGHLFGDAFLSEISNKLLKLSHGDDIVGRIGGDEFIVFIKDIDSIKQVEEHACAIVKEFQALYIEDFIDMDFSCSVGISLSPSHGDQFNELYQNADYALYQAKKQGKNQYVICNEEILNDARLGLAFSSYSAINTRIDSNNDPNNNILTMLIEYVFKILYKSLNIEAAISSILKIVGEHYNVSRAYIFENSDDDLYCQNTFEWCNEGIKPEMMNLQHVSYEKDLADLYTKNFNRNDVFYCRDIKELPKKQYDILAPQGIKAMLQCAIRDSGKFKGYVGFDECSSNRFWTQEQIHALSFISELLSTFLLKQRAQTRLEETALKLQAVLDNQNSWIYAVKEDTFEMLYINAKTQELVPSAKIGQCCHEAFFNRNQPCETCPVKMLRENADFHSLEIFNEILNVWSLADASVLSWDGEIAYLVSCHDINLLKK